MLVLSRKLNQAIMIGDDVRIVVVAVDRDTVKLGIEAPRTIPVHRSEVYDEIQRTNRAAVSEPTKASSEGVRVADLGGKGRRPQPKG
ncbi:MAG: carbon storage regulator CsrA [Candidatus Eremiobacteraeota bacterium]|nr:carbon storage regulator CsrA [Candidatus Eremiobacteraeota bacterium]